MLDHERWSFVKHVGTVVLLGDREMASSEKGQGVTVQLVAPVDQKVVMLQM